MSGLVETTVTTRWHLDGAIVDVAPGERMQMLEPGPWCSKELRAEWRGGRRVVPLASVKPLDALAERWIAMLSDTINAHMEIAIDPDRPLWSEVRALYAVPGYEDHFDRCDYDDVVVKVGRRLGRQPTTLDLKRHLRECVEWNRSAR